MTGSQGRNQDFVSGVLIYLPVNEKGLKKDRIEAKKNCSSLSTCLYFKMK
jgi:hypothetical protein